MTGGKNLIYRSMRKRYVHAPTDALCFSNTHGGHKREVPAASQEVFKGEPETPKHTWFLTWSIDQAAREVQALFGSPEQWCCACASLNIDKQAPADLVLGLPLCQQLFPLHCSHSPSPVDSLGSPSRQSLPQQDQSNER
jgi:hypothetical protein